MNADLRHTLALALPIVLNHLGQLLMQVVDTLMVGRLGTDAIASVAFGGNLTNVVMILGFGLGTAIHVLASNAHGKGESERGHRVLANGLLLAIFCAVVASCLMSIRHAAVLDHLGQPTHVVALGRDYFLFVLWSLVPAFGGICYKNAFEAQMRPWVPLMVLLACVGLNALLNWMFIFGHCGAPMMGVTGAGLATLLARVANFMILTWMARKGGFSWSYLQFKWEAFKNILRVMIPSTLHIALEWGTFLASTLMMGWISAEAIAAHQITLNYIGCVYMFPMGIACAMTIKVGELSAQHNLLAIRRVAFGGIIICTFITGFFGVLGVFLRHILPACFVVDVAVIMLAGKFLVLDAFFQVFDGAQTAMMGVLRGLQDVRVPMWIACASYGLIGIFGAYMLCFKAGFGGWGIWLGLGLAIAVVAVGFAWRLSVKLNEPRWRH